VYKPKKGGEMGNTAKSQKLKAESGRPNNNWQSAIGNWQKYPEGFMPNPCSSVCGSIEMMNPHLPFEIRQRNG